MDEGKLTYRETVWESTNNTYAAFLGMMRGQNIGKALMRV